MKLEVSFDDISLDDWGTTIAQTVRGELESQVRGLVRKELKEQRALWEKAVQRKVRTAIESITATEMDRMVRDSLKAAR